MAADVTEMLSVNSDGTDSVENAEALIRAGRHAIVADDDTAVAVLIAIGMPPERAADQVRVSHGPMS